MIQVKPDENRLNEINRGTYHILRKVYKSFTPTGDMKVGVKVGDVMTREIISVRSSMRIGDCAKIMVEKGVGSLIVAEDQKLMGIVTEGDIIKAVAANMNMKSAVLKVMTRRVFCIKPGKDIYDALVVMKRKKVRRLPVMAGRAVIGLLTEKDILRIQPELFDIAFQNVKIAEEKEKWKRIKAVDEFRWVREGVCQECGVHDLLYKIGNRYLCADCRKHSASEWEE